MKAAGGGRGDDDSERFLTVNKNEDTLIMLAFEG